MDLTGFNYVETRAVWKDRPWVKQIYEGGPIPVGCSVDTLKTEHHIMFDKNKHNKLDGNYLIFLVGELIIIKDGERFSTRCGNKILSIRPTSDYLKMFEGEDKGKIVLRDTVWKEVNTVINNKFIINSYNTTTQTPVSPQVTSTQSETPKKKKKHELHAGLFLSDLDMQELF